MKRLLSPLPLLLLVLFLLPYTAQAHITHRVMPAGTTYFANPGDDISAKLKVLLPGDTLSFNDGTYNSLRLDINGGTNLTGTAAAPITLKATNDGKAIFNPSGSTQPVFVNNSSYVNIIGFQALNSIDYVYYLFGPNSHITLQRDTGHGAAPGDNHVFNIAYGSNNTLVEDCAAWGTGRYLFIAYHSNNVTFRRDYADAPYITNFSPAPRSAFGVYGASNTILENDIGIDAIPPSLDDNYYTGVWETTDDPVNWPTNNTQILGSMFYANCEGYAVNGSAGTSTVFKDDYFNIPYSSTCATDNPNHYDPKGISWSTANGGSVNNVTFVGSNLAFARTSSATPTIQNDVFLNNTTAMSSDPGHSYSDFYGNTSNGTTLVGTDKTVNPGFNTATYGNGGYLFVPSSSPLHAAGSGGADMGANILYEYINGALTSQPLWPWPMESRVVAEHAKSPTYSSSGGLFTTLSGLYSNLIQNPSFETGSLSPWVSVVTAPAVATVTVDNTVAESGVDSGKINVTTSSPNWWYVALRQNNISLVANHLYSLSFWVKASATRNLTYTVQNSAGSVTYAQHTVSAGTGWTQVSTTFTPTVSDSTAQLWIGSATAVGTLWVDNVSLS